MDGEITELRDLGADDDVKRSSLSSSFVDQPDGIEEPLDGSTSLLVQPTAAVVPLALASIEAIDVAWRSFVGQTVRQSLATGLVPHASGVSVIALGIENCDVVLMQRAGRGALTRQCFTLCARSSHMALTERKLDQHLAHFRCTALEVVARGEASYTRYVQSMAHRAVVEDIESSRLRRARVRQERLEAFRGDTQWEQDVYNQHRMTENLLRHTRAQQAIAVESRREILGIRSRMDRAREEQERRMAQIK